MRLRSGSRLLRVPWTPFNLGIFLIVYGGLLLAYFAGISTLNPIQSFPLAITVFGVWLALASFLLAPPPGPYSPPKTLVFAWGSILAALGVVLFAGVTNGSLLPIVLSILLVLGGIGALGYSLSRAGETPVPKPQKPAPGTTGL